MIYIYRQRHDPGSASVCFGTYRETDSHMILQAVVGYSQKYRTDNGVILAMF
jgi:hypothetical protein